MEPYYRSEDGLITLFLGDNLPAMREMPDKAHDLAICDPPYGIGYAKRIAKQASSVIRYTAKEWDLAPPSIEYFNEVRRVSENQIIFGGNYFNLPPTRGFAVWDKCQPEGLDQAMCEYIWTSFDRSAKFFRTSIQQIQFTRIHHTQKPVALYRWLLTNYAKPGDAILDTHLGSGSIAIACIDMGYHLTAYEIDEEYLSAAVDRIKRHLRQPKLFKPDHKPMKQATLLPDSDKA